MAQKKQSQVNLVQKIDITGLYAYADSSHARERELWRGFLSSVLPLLLPQHVENIDTFIMDSLTDSVEDLTVEGNFENTGPQAMRTISAHIAESIGVPLEFALASFYDSEYDVNLPTKLYKFNYIPVKKHIKETQEENMINIWLSRFNQVCNEKSFMSYVEMWKDWLS